MTNQSSSGMVTSPMRNRIEYLPARPVPADGESLMSFVARTASCNDTTVAAILGRKVVARTAPDYQSILRRLANLTRQPLSRIREMTMDGCHSQILAKEGWSAADWGQHCPCAPYGVQRRDWALALAPLCLHCGHLLQMPGSKAIQPLRVPARIASICGEVLAAAHCSATDADALARIQALRVDLSWIARRISRSTPELGSPTETPIGNAAADDLALTGEADDPVGEIPRSPAVRALAITMAWEAQRPWMSPHTLPHPRPVLDRREHPEIHDSQIFTRRILRTGSKRVQTMRLPYSSIRHPRREDLIRLVLGHTELRLDHVPGIYRQDGEPFVTDSAEWLWRSRIAMLLGQCVLLREQWSMVDEPIYRFTRDGNFILHKGSWPTWQPVFYLESDIAHAMNLARMLSHDGLVNYRERRDALRGVVSISPEVAADLPRAARDFDGFRRLGAAWMWFDATCDGPRTQRDAHRLAAYGAALNPEGRLTLRRNAAALCNADADLTRRTRRAGAVGPVPKRNTA